MKKLFLLVAMFCLLLSCTKQEIPTDEKIPINIAIGQQTKANDSNFDANDKVGIYVVNYDNETAGTLVNSGNHADNAGFTYSSSSWTPDNTIYWKDKNTKADFYAYYPYRTNITDVTAHPFSVKADQSSENNFWASDFLWGKATNVTPTSQAVSIRTNHVLSRIIVEIKPGDGFTPESLAAATKSVKITGMKTAATINLSNGTATATGSAEDITPLLSNSTYKAMVVPQTVADNSKLIVVTVNGVDYVYRKGYEFKANTQHSFTITVNKSTSSVNVTIGEWIIDNTNNSGVAEEEDIRYVENGVYIGDGIEIDGLIWAPVNCGYNAENHPNGKFYQWGRKYGQSSSPNTNDPIIENGPVTLEVGQNIDNSNKFYKVHSGSDWVSPSKNNLWNSGSATSPIKTEYDPCPDGWRIPTHYELNALITNSFWDNNNGNPGNWFSGSSEYSNNKPKIFFPANGRRYQDDATVNGIGTTGYYWTSSIGTLYDLPRVLYFVTSYIDLYNEHIAQACGASVRCIKE